MRREYLIGVLRRALGEYQARERGLGQVSGDVESLIDSLAEVAEQDWVARLRHEWGTLEIVHALREAEGRPLSPDDQVALDAAVSALLELLPTADA